MSARVAAAMIPLLAIGAPSVAQERPEDEAPRWWRGNLHTHTLWSDGDEFPELAIDWYKRQGYHFLAITDHNIVPDEIRWIDVARAESRGASLARYREIMGPEWVETRGEGDSLQVRLRTPAEVGPRFEEPNRFLLVPGEEISDRLEDVPIHVNGANLVETIPPQGGNSIGEIIANDVAAVREQGLRTGRLVLAQLNHPNYEWAIEPEHLAAMEGVDPEGAAFFEVYNGHWLVHNAGDSLHPSTDRAWDLALTDRLERGEPLLYGVGTDDTHDYHMTGSGGAQPGRGWVVVRAETLASESLIRAMLAGRFYASTGVELDSIDADRDALRIAVHPEAGVDYVTQFIGTRREREEPGGVGVVLAEVAGVRAEYRFRGDELYVRARVVSSKLKENAPEPGAFETAWVQPVAPGRAIDGT